MSKNFFGIALAPAVFIPTVAFAATNNYHNGGYETYTPSSSDSGVTSIYTNIYTPAYPVVGSQSNSSAWDLITGTNGEWVQTGWYDQMGEATSSKPDGVHYFFEYMTASGTVFDEYSVYGPATSSTHAHRTAKDSSGNWYGQVDGVNIASGYTGFKGNGIQYSEEVQGATDPYKCSIRWYKISKCYYG